MARALEPSILAALGLATALTGCTAGPVIDNMLPAAAPARPATAYEYPAVHDMPPARAAQTMTEEQQLKLEKELTAVRDRQEAKDGAAKKTAQSAKKKPTAADNAQAAGVKTNP